MSRFQSSTISSTVAWLRMALQLGRPYRRWLWGAWASMAAMGAATGILAFLIGPAFKFLLTGEPGSLGMLSKGWPTWLPLSSLKDVWILPAVIALVGAVKAVSYLGQFYCMGGYAQRVARELRQKLFEKFLTLSTRARNRFQTGDLLARLSADVEAVELAAAVAVSAYVRDGLQLIILFAVAFSMSWKLALMACIFVPLAIIPAKKLTQFVFHRIGESQKSLGTLAGQVIEGLSGMKTIQAYNAQSAELVRFDEEAKRHERALVRAAWARGSVPALMEVLAAASIGATLGMAAWATQEDPERLVSLLAAIGLAYQPAKEIGRVTQFVVRAQTAMERIQEVLSSEDEAWPGLERVSSFERAIEFQNVDFEYTPGKRVLAGVSFSIPKGKTTAVVGSSGGGKSTLVALLLGFLKPTHGSIAFDRRDLLTLKVDALRSQFAWLTQDVFLFSESVFENIRFARPEASEEEVFEAARLAHVLDFVSQWPNGMKTELGERGAQLSGGQKQRIALARSILSRAPILILDEPTSNLDAESEVYLAQTLRGLAQFRTLLIVTHRLALAQSADQVIVLDAGTLVESGTHFELLAKGGLYERLWRSQGGPLS